jgi:hypothetical protein
LISAPLTAQNRQTQLRRIVKTISHRKLFVREINPEIITIIKVKARNQPLSF